MKTLKDVLPIEFCMGEFHDDRAYKYKDVEVIIRHDFGWPGSHKNICVWYELANGYAVGWNENPARGWSFPIIRLRYKIRIVCLGCGKNLGEKTTSDPEMDGMISHSLCEDCAEKIRKEE